MSAYFVTHPYMDKTAVVHAPSTEKARTTFLDWLERNGLVNRRWRQSYRRDMVAERLEDPNVPADVELHYGYEEAPTIGYVPPRRAEVEGEYREVPVGEEPETPEGGFREDDEEGPDIGREALKERKMPIQDIALGGLD